MSESVLVSLGKQKAISLVNSIAGICFVQICACQSWQAKKISLVNSFAAICFVQICACQSWQAKKISLVNSFAICFVQICLVSKLVNSFAAICFVQICACQSWQARKLRSESAIDLLLRLNLCRSVLVSLGKQKTYFILARSPVSMTRVEI